MVGVEAVEMLGEDRYRLTLDSPIGRLEPEATVVEHGARTIRWVYASVLEGGGRVEVSPDEDGCTITRASSTSGAGSSTGRPASPASSASPARTGNARSHASST